jgi:hypothetical protein
VIEKFANNAITQLSGAIGAGDTSLSVADASAFPTTGQFRILIDSEVMTVTSVSGTTFTVTRNSETVGGGSGAAAHANLAQVAQILTAGALANCPRALTSTGDLEYLTSSGAVTRLGIGSSNQVLLVSGGIPAWGSLSFSNITGTLTAGQLPTTGAIGASWADFYQSGAIYPGGAIVSYAATTGALTANTAYFVPFIAGQGQSVTSLRITITTVAAGKNVRLGIYKGDGSLGKPSTLVADGGSSSANPGAAPIDVEQTISATLAANTLYWLCVVSDGTPSISFVPSTACMWVTSGLAKVGNATMNQTPNTGFTASFTFGSWPNPWTAALSGTNGNQPAIGLKF